jgi:hypothetical protein
MPKVKHRLKVFLCHAHADRDKVQTLYSHLTKDGVDAWLDKEKLLPGQDWELEIRKAVHETDVIIVCLSKHFSQAGFRQKEVRLALDSAMEKIEGEIFIIPARLEECDTLENLKKWHWVDLFEDNGYEMLVRALQVRAHNVGSTLPVTKNLLSQESAAQKSKNPKTYKISETIQKQRELEADIEKLKKISGWAAADIGLQYSSLMDRIEKWGFGKDEVILSAAGRVFKTKQDEYARARIWAFNFRKEITRKLPNEDFQPWLEKANKDINFLSKDEFLTLCYVSKKGISGISLFEQLLDYGLKAFGILGVDNVHELCKIIVSVIPNLVNEKDDEKLSIALGQLKDNWFTKGASGRYLSGKLASVGHSQFILALQAKLVEWKNNEEYPPNLLGANASLWSSEPLYSLTPHAELYLRRHFNKYIQWRTPFGPIKAEFDPRLTRSLVETDKHQRPVKGFFWDEHPIWDKVIDTQSLCIIAERGMGSTSLILMGRHVRRFWGNKPSLSMFLQMHGNAEEIVFWSMLEQALFEQLIRDLVEDPFWLLNAPISAQQMIVSFLIRQAGDFPVLLLKIDEAGLPEKEREVVGLALFPVGDAATYQSHLQFAELIKVITRAMLNAARPRMKDDQFYVFMWIEFKDAATVDGWMELIEHAGLNSLTTLKLFVPAPLYSAKVRRSLRVETLHWERQQLKDMITKRIKQTGMLHVEDFPLDELLDKADGSPARLIEAGNHYGFPRD